MFGSCKTLLFALERWGPVLTMVVTQNAKTSNGGDAAGESIEKNKLA